MTKGILKRTVILKFFRIPDVFSEDKLKATAYAKENRHANIYISGTFHDIFVISDIAFV